MAEDDRLTEKQLEEQDGTQGKKAYVAVNGKVYDVTGSDSWEDGEHYEEHHAGGT